MRAAIYMRVGNPDQATIQPQKEELTGQIFEVLGDGLKREGYAGNNIPNLQEFLQGIRSYDRCSNLTLTYHQLF